MLQARSVLPSFGFAQVPISGESAHFPISGEIFFEKRKIVNIAPMWEEGGKGVVVDDCGGRYVQEKGGDGWLKSAHFR